jgi:hypothetical protein
MQIEWDRLFQKQVWDIASVAESSDVAEKARKDNDRGLWLRLWYMRA